MPVWIKEKLLLKRLLLQELSRLAGHPVAEAKLLFPEHHLSHAASAFYPSPFEEAAILTIDGVGEWATASICHGKGNGIEILRELRFPHSVGLLYSAFTYYLGFRVNSGEYKLMGLAPYGDPTSERTRRFEAADPRADGRHRARTARSGSTRGTSTTPRGCAWPTSRPGSGSSASRGARPRARWRQEHCDLALAIQRVTERVVLAMAAEAKRLTGSANLCLAGGVALNCVANGKLLRSGIVDAALDPARGRRRRRGARRGAVRAPHRPRQPAGRRARRRRPDARLVPRARARGGARCAA